MFVDKELRDILSGTCSVADQCLETVIQRLSDAFDDEGYEPAHICVRYTEQVQAMVADARAGNLMAQVAIVGWNRISEVIVQRCEEDEEDED